MLDILFGRRDQEIEIDRLELIGAQRGAVFAVHRPETWEIAGVEVRGVIYHAVVIEERRITRIEDHLDRDQALKIAGA